MGFGFEFPDVANAQCAYRGLLTECATRYGKALSAAGDSAAGRAWSLLGERYKRDFGPGAWWEDCGMHGTADAVNAGVATNSTAEAIRSATISIIITFSSLSSCCGRCSS